jgi:hypothetical protein
MHVLVIDCSMHKNNSRRLEFSTGKMEYFFCNFIRYKIFLLAAHRMLLLHSGGHAVA